MGSSAEHTDLQNRTMLALQKKYLGDVQIKRRSVGRVYYKVGNQFRGPYMIGEKGDSDLYGTFKGGFSFNIEIKTGNAVLTKEQKKRLAQAEKLGAGAFVCYNIDKLLKEFDLWTKTKASLRK